MHGGQNDSLIRHQKSYACVLHSTGLAVHGKIRGCVRGDDRVKDQNPGGDLGSSFGKETALRKQIAVVFALLVMSAAGVAQVPTAGNIYFGYSLFRGRLSPKDRREPGAPGHRCFA